MLYFWGYMFGDNPDIHGESEEMGIRYKIP